MHSEWVSECVRVCEPRGPETSERGRTNCWLDLSLTTYELAPVSEDRSLVLTVGVITLVAEDDEGVADCNTYNMVSMRASGQGDKRLKWLSLLSFWLGTMRMRTFSWVWLFLSPLMPHAVSLPQSMYVIWCERVVDVMKGERKRREWWLNSKITKKLKQKKKNKRQNASTWNVRMHWQY